MNLIKMFKLGQKYMEICPIDKKLTFTFPEIKMVRYVKLGVTYVPFLIVVIFAWQYYAHPSLAISCLTALFAFSLPIQGILWLGQRANTPLTLNLLAWYNYLQQKLFEAGIISEIETKNKQINFMAFARLLNLSKLHFGHYFDGQNDNND